MHQEVRDCQQISGGKNWSTEDGHMSALLIRCLEGCFLSQKFRSKTALVEVFILPAFAFVFIFLFHMVFTIGGEKVDIVDGKTITDFLVNKVKLFLYG